MAKGLKWADCAASVGRSKEWTTAALLGQMPMSKEEAEAASAILELDAEDAWATAKPRLTKRSFELWRGRIGGSG